jgi:hypothetical protein
MLSHFALFIIDGRTRIRPDALLAKIKTAYQGAATYSDRVEVFDVESKPRKLIDHAEIRFVAPHRFRFAYYVRKKLAALVTVDANGRRHSRRFPARSTYFADDVDSSFANDVASYLWGGNGLVGDPPLWEYVVSESVHGRPCLRLSHDFGTSHEFVWVDAKTFLVVKARQKWERKFGSGDDLYIFHPKVTYRSP